MFLGRRGWRRSAQVQPYGIGEEGRRQTSSLGVVWKDGRAQAKQHQSQEPIRTVQRLNGQRGPGNGQRPERSEREFGRAPLADIAFALLTRGRPPWEVDLVRRGRPEHATQGRPVRDQAYGRRGATGLQCIEL